MKKIVWIAVAVIVIVSVVVFLLVYYSKAPLISPTPQASPTSTTQLTYSSAKYGFSFSYPSDYVVTERFNNDPDHSITLETKEDVLTWHADEGPAVMSIDIIPNPSSTLLLQWLLENPNYSNYQIPYVMNTQASSTTVGNTGIPALTYDWSGEVYGENLVFSLRGNVVIFTGTYGDPNDQIKKDFDALIKTITIP